ncbi:beta-L-arabinofuranosidase domain-containing protein [Aquirufa sp. OSTEICH-129A]
MKTSISLACLLLLVGIHGTLTAQKSALNPLAYEEIPLGSIRPTGWLKQQVDLMVKNSTGHLDENHKKIKTDNGWLGGKGDDWEETPYWLDGALPAAYLSGDSVLIKKVLNYVHWTLTHQRPSGFFGPYSKYEKETGKMAETGDQAADWWPRMVMLKILQQYYQVSGDPRVIPFMTKYFQFQLKNLKNTPLVKYTEWAQSRGGDNLMVVYWLYRQTKAPFLLELGDLIYSQTTNWTDLLGKRDWAIQAAYQQNDQRWMDRHAVNVGMGIKLPAIYSQAKKDPYYLQALKTGFRDLMTLHGLPHGMFSGDEDLHGNDPIQGTELCATTETMFSLEQIISITGDTEYMDALERMTFNALPAQITDDFNGKQYFGMANQVEVKRGVYSFSLPFWRGMNNVYGPYSGYTCCTANMHQAWPKYMSHLWYRTKEGGFAALIYGPNKLSTTVNKGIKVQIEERTNYPFEDQIQFLIQPEKKVTFPMEFRIPSWCEEAILLVNGKEVLREKGGKIAKIAREWTPGDQVTLQFPMKIRTQNWGKNSRSVEYGPLIFALKIQEEFQKQVHPQEGEYYEILPKSDWNFALLKKFVEKPVEHATLIKKPFPKDFLWNQASAPMEITLEGKKLPDWKTNAGVAYQPVTTRNGDYLGPSEEKSEKITLIPFGFTRLRIVAFPVVK